MACTLSVAMIVCNEAAFLPECLEHLRPIADEICIVDTGSADATLEIARQAGCTTGSYAWNADFAAARNASLDLCHCDWIFVLDADERLDAADFAAFKSLLDGSRTNSFRFTTRNYTRAENLSGFVPLSPENHWARGFPGWFPSQKVRLFPRHPKIRFENRIHEVPTASILRLGYSVLPADIPIHHYPLLRTEAEIARKQRLYIELGEAKVRDHPEDAQAHTELGSQYLETGEAGKALVAYREALRIQPGSGERVKDLGNALYLLGMKTEALQAFNLATQIEPDNGDAWRNLGVLHADVREWKESAACFERALLLSPESRELQQYLAHVRDHIPAGDD